MTEAERKAYAAKPTVYCLRFADDKKTTLIGVYSTASEARWAADKHWHGEFVGNGNAPWSWLHSQGYRLDIMKLDAPAVSEPHELYTVPEP